MIRRFEFDSFEGAESTIESFIEFHNGQQLHSAIGYMTPREVYVECNEENKEEQLPPLMQDWSINNRFRLMVRVSETPIDDYKARGNRKQCNRVVDS